MARRERFFDENEAFPNYDTLRTTNIFGLFFSAEEKVARNDSADMSIHTEQSWKLSIELGAQRDQKRKKCKSAFEKKREKVNILSLSLSN